MSHTLFLFMTRNQLGNANNKRRSMYDFNLRLHPTAIPTVIHERCDSCNHHLFRHALSLYTFFLLYCIIYLLFIIYLKRINILSNAKRIKINSMINKFKFYRLNIVFVIISPSSQCSIFYFCRSFELIHFDTQKIQYCDHF